MLMMLNLILLLKNGFVGTGALLSKISFNEGENVPGIAHAVVLEVLENR